MIPLPYKLLAAVLALALYGVGCDYAGRRSANQQWEAKMAEAEHAAAAKYEAQALQLNKLSADLEYQKANQKVVYETITKTVDRIVDRPVYRNVCIDDDGMRQINDALAGKSSTDSGQPGSTVPAASAP